MRKPTTGIGCCARPANGHAAAAPPSSVITERRFIGLLLDQRDHGPTIAGQAPCIAAKAVPSCPSRVKTGCPRNVLGESAPPQRTDINPLAILSPHCVFGGYSRHCMSRRSLGLPHHAQGRAQAAAIGFLAQKRSRGPSFY